MPDFAQQEVLIAFKRTRVLNNKYFFPNLIYIKARAKLENSFKKN